MKRQHDIIFQCNNRLYKVIDEIIYYYAYNEWRIWDSLDDRLPECAVYIAYKKALYKIELQELLK